MKSPRCWSRGASSTASSRAARGAPRAHVREQGRGRRRVEPAPALSDLRDQLRLQDDRDRGRIASRRIYAEHGRVLFQDIIAAENWRTAAGCWSRTRRPSRSCRTSRATPTRATLRRRQRTRAWPTMRRRELARSGGGAQMAARPLRQSVADVVSVRAWCCTRRRPTAATTADFTFTSSFIRRCASPHLLKYLAGPEIGGGNFLSDTLPEAKAAELRALPTSTTHRHRWLIHGRCLTPILRVARPRARRGRRRDASGRPSTLSPPWIATTRATRSTRSTSSAKTCSSSGSRERWPASARSCSSPRGCPAASDVLPDGDRRARRRLARHRRSDRRHARPHVPEAQRVDPHRRRAESRPGDVAARHRAGGADRDSAGQAAPVRSALGDARRRASTRRVSIGSRATACRCGFGRRAADSIAHGFATSRRFFPGGARRAGAHRRGDRARRARRAAGPARRTASRISTRRPAASSTS